MIIFNRWNNAESFTKFMKMINEEFRNGIINYRRFCWIRCSTRSRRATIRSSRFCDANDGPWFSSSPLAFWLIANRSMSNVWWKLKRYVLFRMSSTSFVAFFSIVTPPCISLAVFFLFEEEKNEFSSITKKMRRTSSIDGDLFN